MDLTRRKNNLNDDDRCNRHNNEAVKAEKGDPIADAEVCKLFTPLVESQAHTPMMQELFGEDALGVAWVTFLEVLHKERRTAVCNMAGFLAMKLKYALLDKAKKERALRSKVQPAEAELLAKVQAEAEGLQALWEREEFLLEVRNNKALSGTEKEMLLKFLQEGYDFQTLAREQGAKLKTVHKTFERALKKLRRLLKEE